MGFQNLAHVHARGYAQGIQHHINRRTIRHIWHVFHRHNLGDHTFIAMTPRHFVPGLQTPLHRYINLDHFLDARGQFIALGKFLFLFLKSIVERLALLRQAFLDLLELHARLLVGKPNIKPMMRVNTVQIFLRDFARLWRVFWVPLLLLYP